MGRALLEFNASFRPRLKRPTSARGYSVTAAQRAARIDTSRDRIIDAEVAANYGRQELTDYCQGELEKACTKPRRGTTSTCRL